MTLQSGDGLNAFGVPIRWNSVDAVTTWAPKMRPTSQIQAFQYPYTNVPSAATTTTRPPNTSATNLPSNGSGGGLSIGAKAKIGIGVSIACIGICCGFLVFFCLLKLKRNRGKERAGPLALESFPQGEGNHHTKYIGRSERGLGGRSGFD